MYLAIFFLYSKYKSLQNTDSNSSQPHWLQPTQPATTEKHGRRYLRKNPTDPDHDRNILVRAARQRTVCQLTAPTSLPPAYLTWPRPKAFKDWKQHLSFPMTCKCSMFKVKMKHSRSQLKAPCINFSLWWCSARPRSSLPAVRTAWPRGDADLQTTFRHWWISLLPRKHFAWCYGNCNKRQQSDQKPSSTSNSFIHTSEELTSRCFRLTEHCTPSLTIQGGNHPAASGICTVGAAPTRSERWEVLW